MLSFRRIGLIAGLLVVGVFIVGPRPRARAEVRLPSLVGDNMVLQRGHGTRIWGWAAPGEIVTVTMDGDRYVAKTTKDGKWQIEFPRLEPGKRRDMTIAGSQSKPITIKNIAIGEVWVCSGQSNMSFSLARAADAEKMLATADRPDLRLFVVPDKMAAAPQDTCGGKWNVSSRKTASGFSAIAYYFGEQLQRELGVPVGLIQSAWGGTPAEAWTAREFLDKDPEIKDLTLRWEKQMAQINLGNTNEEYERQKGLWNPAVLKAMAAHKTPPLQPMRPASLYNAMIAPLINYKIAGVIWYQGENNVPRALQYRKVFPLLIESWRSAWDQADLPFGFVQIAPFKYPKQNPDACPLLRESQLQTLLRVRGTGMVVTMDVGNPQNIHPTNKQAVGSRLADWAMATKYDRPRVWSGPIYSGCKVEGNDLRLTFDHVGGGLATRDGKPPSHFLVAGEDHKFHAAKARIDGATIVVGSSEVAQPVAARYGWQSTAEPNLMNKEGLPASPFRTDIWPIATPLPESVNPADIKKPATGSIK